MLKSITRLNSALIICAEQAESCNDNQTRIFTAELNSYLFEFMRLAAAEKKLVSTVAMHNIDRVKVHIAQYNALSDTQLLQKQITPTLEHISTTLNDVINAYHYNLKEQTEYHILLLILISLLILVVSIFHYFYSNKYIKQLIHKSDDLTHLFHHVLNRIKDLDLKAIKSRLSSINTNPNEKKIYSLLLFSFEKLENEKLKTDLYQRLYNLLGYEIRGITNTIQGGVKLLAVDKDERELVLAKDVITATHTLENLAENFNQLSNIDISKDDNIVNLNKLSSDLIVLLASKSKNLSKSIECYVDNTLPLTFYGHQTGLFWLLLMQMSDALATQGYEQILLTINCSGTKRVDQLKISLNFYLYSSDYSSIDSIEQLPWSKSHKTLITNKALARTLIGKIKNYQVTRQVIDNTSCFSTSFDIQPERYQTQTSLLVDKKILICGASAIQTNVLDKMLTEQGADVVVANTPNDIFKSINQLDDNDGILLTNTIKGVKLNTFCKIIKARLGKKNIKIFLSVSTSNQVKEVFEHIDHIFYHPCPPSDFISNMLEHLEKDHDDTAVALPKLLIVEDDKLQQFILKKILSDFEYECETMDDGQQVVDNLDKLDHDIIFMDCIMPNLGGVDATKRIRAYEKQHKKQPSIIIGATALTSNEEHKLCIDAGMDYVLHKPYKKDVIYASLKKYIAIGKIK
ncbi:response regulator [Psychromonas marina]|nr:response regulator [Psychromonas marina]